ncbi:OLC1v1023221C1 [Oldenlandia corymbosa var. corymbosa]|uniref:OLC1v1023220C1 n=1 Tax=Oldenlandia corymbosa var. corymbosa TaxID=529605 RepID=A0AAV1C150_OLDCO|nr:OLC1v1023220C1 [Oldenlandia corymbosa var. corymbosa]CAI9088793.1 OLC1v1023221C1 [Oldenlandia corymbosa var. corymbosa]
MAKAAILVSALCFLAIATFAHAQQKVYNTYGGVYCDPCNVEFHTRLSYPIPGARVQVQCRNRDTNAVTVTKEGWTNNDGGYSIDVIGDHEEEICEVSALSSPDAKCNVPFTNADKARVLLTENSGVQGTSRYANPIGFKTTTPDAGCKDVLAELGMTV